MPLVLGSYTFPVGFYVAEYPLNSDVPSAKLPRADGARLSTPYLTERVFRLKGSLMPSLGPLFDQLDAMRAGMQQGPANFYPAGGGRYHRNVVKRPLREVYQPTWPGRMADIEVDLVTGDPYAYETAVNTVTSSIGSSGATFTLSTGGSATAVPSMALTVGGSGTVALSAVLTNTTTGDSCTLIGSVAGGSVIVIDSLNQVVTVSGTDSIALFDGLFPTLLGDANNVFEVSYTAGTITSVVSTWQNRWY